MTFKPAAFAPALLLTAFTVLMGRGAFDAHSAEPPTARKTKSAKPTLSNSASTNTDAPVPPLPGARPKTQSPAAAKPTPARSTSPSPAAAPANRAANSAPPRDNQTKLYSLKYKFRPNEKIRTQVTHLVTCETTIGGTSQTAETISRSEKQWRVIEVTPNGEMTFENSVLGADMSHKITGSAEVKFNSATDKSAPPGYESVSEAIGKPLSIVTIEPSGAMVKKIDKHKPAAADATGNQMVMPLPKQPVPIGYVWNVPQEAILAVEESSPIRVKLRQRYKLAAVEGDLATIEVETLILSPVNDPKLMAQLIQRLNKGKIEFNLRSGRVVNQEMGLDEMVIDFHGPASSLRYLAKYTEELLPADAPIPKNAALERDTAK
jgi:hypothetical protein